MGAKIESHFVRKLIFSAKLEEIEKAQNQNSLPIFIFHSLLRSPSQWRFLKNFLFFYGQLANKELRPPEPKGGGPFSVRRFTRDFPVLGDPLTGGGGPPGFTRDSIGPRFAASLLNYQARSTDSSAASQPPRLPESADAVLRCRVKPGPSLLRAAVYGSRPFQSTKSPGPGTGSGGPGTGSSGRLRPDSERTASAVTKRLGFTRRGLYAGRDRVASVPALASVKLPLSSYNRNGGAGPSVRRFLEPISKKRLAPAEAGPLRGSTKERELGKLGPSGARPERREARAARGPGSVKGRPKGCLFLTVNPRKARESPKGFDQCSKISRESADEVRRSRIFTRVYGLELVNKTLRALDFNNNLILLYGLMNSTVVNHVDIKETLILDAQSTYQQLFLSMHSLSIGLNFCLHQKIDEFFCLRSRPKGYQKIAH